MNSAGNPETVWGELEKERGVYKSTFCTARRRLHVFRLMQWSGVEENDVLKKVCTYSRCVGHEHFRATDFARAYSSIRPESLPLKYLVSLSRYPPIHQNEEKYIGI